MVWCRSDNNSGITAYDYRTVILGSNTQRPSQYHARFRCWYVANGLPFILTLKRKCLHFDEIFITGCTESCQNDNFQCSQWWKFRQNDDIFVSVNLSYFFSLLLPGLTSHSDNTILSTLDIWRSSITRQLVQKHNKWCGLETELAKDSSWPAMRCLLLVYRDYVIKWKPFPRYWSFVRGIHRWPVIFAWTNGWVNNRKAGDFRRDRTHYDVTHR